MARGDLVRFLRPALHVALAHHPLCDWFQSDVYAWGRVRLCRGCILAGSAFVAGVIGAWSLLLPHVDWLVLGALGLSLGVPQLVTYVWRAPGGVRAAIKLLGGAGLACLFVALTKSGLSVLVLAATATALALAFLVLQALRVRRMLDTCRGCPWAMDWDRCPGFGGI